MFLRRTAATVLCALCCVNVPASATLLAPLDLNELVASADLIAIGRIVHATARRSEGGGVETALSLGAYTLLKGAADGYLEFFVPGGRDGRYRTVVPGSPVLDEGDEVVVFLRQVPGGRLVLAGFSQGLVPVSRRLSGGEATVLAPAAASPTGGRIVRGDADRTRIPLGAFARQIQDLVDRNRAEVEAARTRARDRSKQGGAH